MYISEKSSNFAQKGVFMRKYKKEKISSKVIIDSRFSYLYGSFYLYGLVELFGWSNIRFSYSTFSDLSDPEWNIRFIISVRGVTKRYFIQTNDSYHISQEDYDWCDVYGHVNANYTYYPKEKYPKIVSLVPSFGIRAVNLYRTVVISVCCFFKSFEAIVNRVEWNKWKNCHEVNKTKNIKLFFTRYYKCFKNRLPYLEYEKEIPVRDDYVFFLSTLWYNDDYNQNDKCVNLRRATFIRACYLIKRLKFEGGLLADLSSTKEKFTDVLVEKGETFKSWIDKTKSSLLVFNTPAFWNCHGWKLGEYLALGKCIVSTKLSNDLPCPLCHGENIHFVENSQEAMAEAIEYILVHPEYRKRLEKGAQIYWNAYGTPIQSLKLLGIEA